MGPSHHHWKFQHDPTCAITSCGRDRDCGSVRACAPGKGEWSCSSMNNITIINNNYHHSECYFDHEQSWMIIEYPTTRVNPKMGKLRELGLNPKALWVDLQHLRMESLVDWLVDLVDLVDWLLDLLIDWLIEWFGYGSKLGTPIIGWLILN